MVLGPAVGKRGRSKVRVISKTTSLGLNLAPWKSCVNQGLSHVPLKVGRLFPLPALEVASGLLTLRIFILPFLVLNYPCDSGESPRLSAVPSSDLGLKGHRIDI